MSYHTAALTFQVVSVCQDETLLAAVRHNILLRNRDLELFDMLCLDLYLANLGGSRFGRRILRERTALPN